MKKVFMFLCFYVFMFLIVSCSYKQDNTDLSLIGDNCRLTESDKLIKKYTVTFCADDLINRLNQRTTRSTEEPAQSDDFNLDLAVTRLLENATDEQVEYFMTYKDEITVDIETSTYINENDVSNDAELEYYQTAGALESKLINSFNNQEVFVEINPSETTRSSTPDMETYEDVDIKFYKTTDVTRSSGSQLVSAARLAYFFALNNDMDSIEELGDLLDVNINTAILRIPTIADPDNNTATRSFVKKSNDFYDDSLPGSEEWIEKNAKNGDIILRAITSDGTIYGYYDHAGIFDREKYITNGRDKWSRCVIASYPDYSAPSIDPRRIPTRVWYGAYEAVANFIDTHTCRIIRIKDDYNTVRNGKSLSARALDNSINKYINTTKYDPWMDIGTAASEFLRITNYSAGLNNTINYCSRISWYGYKKEGIDINGDTRSYGEGGNIIVPSDLYLSTTRRKEVVRVEFIRTDLNCFEETWFKTEYQNADPYFKTVFYKSRSR